MQINALMDEENRSRVSYFINWVSQSYSLVKFTPIPLVYTLQLLRRRSNSSVETMQVWGLFNQTLLEIQSKTDYINHL